jgi:hypothetical protein
MQQWHGKKRTSSEEMGLRNIVDHGGYLPEPAGGIPALQKLHEKRKTGDRSKKKTTLQRKPGKDKRI